MKLKTGLLAVCLLVSTSVTAMAAQDKGTPVKFPNWGVITVPTSVYMEKGWQPMLTADAYHQDMEELLGHIYPKQPETYQLVKKEDAHFQYAYLLHYSMTVWEVEAAVERQQEENAYLRDIGSQPDLKTLMTHANEILPKYIPAAFRLQSPIIAKKKNGRIFYECTAERALTVNDNAFTESVRAIAWQHGPNVEIAVVVGQKGSYCDLSDTVVSMLETAQKMPKK